MTRSPSTDAASHIVRVAAPSRLHFGMFSFGDARRRQFGGVGLMVDRPGVELRLSPAERFSAGGPLAERAAGFARAWAASIGFDHDPLLQVQVVRAPRQHIGLGVGTQLALSTAAGLNAFFGRPEEPARAAARRVGRGRRSAIGTQGFDQGGLIFDHGKAPGEEIAPPGRSVRFPSAWRLVLLLPRAGVGLSGRPEEQAFARLPAVPAAAASALEREAADELLPALGVDDPELARAEADFERFSASLYRFGRLAGECFAAVQGGPYNGAEVTGLIELIRSLGVSGVGQTSWGPTVFCVLSDAQRAEQFTARLADRREAAGFEPVIAQASAGASVSLAPQAEIQTGAVDKSDPA